MFGDIKQDIKNTGNMNNSIGNNNKLEINSQTETFNLAKKAVEDLQDVSLEEKTDALDMIETAEQSFKDGLFEKALRFLDKIPAVAKSLPAIVNLVTLVTQHIS
ncbi:hypothetical protein ACQUEF_01605 [Vagococcus fluvialis]|uniref:hypothetical protein n=1 Tax=Vagococcus fluvialis TaxID=2738 RepID=UPI003D11DE83